MGSCTLLPIMPGDTDFKILIVGGSAVDSPKNTSDTTNTAEIFTFNSNNPRESEGWKNINPTNKKRFLSDSVLLPDGTVLVTNGAAVGTSDDNDVPVNEIELFDPKSGDWSVIDSLDRKRLYHSTALLLADGSVVAAGSTGHKWSTNPEHYEKEIEIIKPPYFGNNHRPEITNAPLEITYNKDFEITSPNSSEIEKIAIIRCSSVTHTNNMDQRYVGLSITDVTNTLKVHGPNDSTFAPPGYYMLFLVNHDGIPSTAKIIKLG